MGKKKTEATTTVEIERLCCGTSCGEYGVTCYRLAPRPKDDGAALYGLPLEPILGMELWEGAVVEVTVRLVKQGRKKLNPWYARERRRRRKAGLKN